MYNNYSQEELTSIRRLQRAFRLREAIVLCVVYYLLVRGRRRQRIVEQEPQRNKSQQLGRPNPPSFRPPIFQDIRRVDREHRGLLACGQLLFKERPLLFWPKGESHDG